MATFSPPVDAVVSPVYIGEDPTYPVDPLMQRLMRHYKQQERGRNIFLMSDGTFRDSQVDGQPPNMIEPPTDPYVRSIGPQAGTGLLVEDDTFQVPYVVRTYYGGSANPVSAAEATALTNAGYVVT